MHYEVENKQPTSATTRKDSRKSTSFSIQNNYLGIRKTPFLEGWNSGKGNWSCSRISFTGSMWQQVTSFVSDHLQIANPTGLDSVQEKRISLADLQPHTLQHCEKPYRLFPCIWNIAEFALDMYAKVQLCFVIADGEYCSHLPRLEQGCAWTEVLLNVFGKL